MLVNEVSAVTDADFRERVLSSGVPVLVDFWADWCAPCRALAPVLEAMAAEPASRLAGRFRICKVDVDKNPETVERYGVMGLPTLILFKGGTPVDRTSRARTREEIEAWLGSHLESHS